MIKKSFLFFALTLILSFNNACQAVGSYPDYAAEFVGEDKFENFNRKVFNFNLKANKYVIRPVNTVWASILPQYGMDRVQSFYTNMKYPARLVSCLIQKDYKSSRTETVRFLTNTTLGLAGLYDVAQAKFKIEPHQEDMGQALAYRKVKQGPYVVLPIVAQGNTRDIVGQVLDLPLNPSSYIMGPFSAISTGVSLMNSTTSMQPIYKMADGYADPYEVSKQLWGIEKYIQNNNLDRASVFKEKTAKDQLVKVSNVVRTSSLKPDIELSNFNPQGSEIDALRTMLFDSQKLNNSIWSELSVWNRSFSKKIKTSSVSVDSSRPNCKYRYILQKDKKSPLAVLYPSIGEGIMSGQSTVFAKILYDEGYSVAILGSPFNWEYVKSMPSDYRPGVPSNDAKYLREVTSKVFHDLREKKKCEPDKKILVGTSFGGLTTLFVAAQEEKDNKLGFSNYISINPPIEIHYALKQIDKYCADCQNSQNSSEDLKLRAAVTAKKVVQVSQMGYDIKAPEKPVTLPFTDAEAKMAISYAMKMKLSNLVFTVENGSTMKTSELNDRIKGMTFADYAKKYLVGAGGQSFDQLSYASSLYSIEGFLNRNGDYKIYHTLDDCFVAQEHLAWLKKQSGNKTVLFSNGSHLGCLYRREFIEEFKKATELKDKL